jgi:stage II sporulation protein D
MGDPSIRVLLFEGLAEVRVADASGRPLGAAAWVEGGGLRLEAGEILPRWRAQGDGPVQVNGLVVRGAVEVVAVREGSGARPGLAVVNDVPLEEYLAGSLGREMYGSWGQGALRAQAVASRTYALHEALKQRDLEPERPWQLSATTRSQVYAGVAAESPAVEEALRATRGEILTHEGTPILAVFHSSSGGRTASAEEVWGEAREYLVSVPVEDEWDSPDSYWRAPVSRTTLGRAVAAVAEDVGAILSVRVTERTGSGRVARLELVGQSGTVSVTARRLRGALGESTLKSTLFEVREDAGDFVFVGSGNGHGVGMSQWGARAMARRGDDYRKILGTFYPGARITRLGGGR